jgi:hypothetical protein
MSAKQVSDVVSLVAAQHGVTRFVWSPDSCWRYSKGVTPMHFAFPHVLRDIFGPSTPHDEHLLAGADEQSIQALGVSQPVLARFQQDIAMLCPDLVHEAQMGLGRR